MQRPGALKQINFYQTIFPRKEIISYTHPKTTNFPSKKKVLMITRKINFPNKKIVIFA